MDLKPISRLSHIENAPDNPVQLFKEFLNLMTDPQNATLIPMTLATLNKEFGVLNRTVLFRGLSEKPNEYIRFVTETNTQKYKDIKDNPRVSIVFLFIREINGTVVTRQIRINGTAIEIEKNNLKELWNEEPLFSKIRSNICECGAPVDWKILKEKHDKLLSDIENQIETLKQTETYTSFHIIPNTFDFYYTENEAIADRVVYRKNPNNAWTQEHVYP